MRGVGASRQVGQDDPEPMKATPKRVAAAKAFVLKKWQERAEERGGEKPDDLIDACKFCSLFAQSVFGGEIRGNWHHQWVEREDGKVLDLTEGCRGLDALKADGIEIYEHDESFFGNPEHLESMDSCLPRIQEWVREFREILSLRVKENRNFWLVGEEEVFIPADVRKHPVTIIPNDEYKALERLVDVLLKDAYQTGADRHGNVGVFEPNYAEAFGTLRGFVMSAFGKFELTMPFIYEKDGVLFETTPQDWLGNRRSLAEENGVGLEEWQR